MNNMSVHKRQKTGFAPLATNSRFLVTSENGLGGRFLPAVDKDASGFQASGDP